MTLRVGEILLEEGIITQQQLDDALESQRVSGGPIGRNLILSGAVTRLSFYEALAKRWGTDFVNLIQDPPQEGILDGIDPDIMIDGQWIPYSMDGSTLTVATSVEPNLELVSEVMRVIPSVRLIAFLTTTDWDINQTVTRECRGELAYIAAEELANSNPDASAKGGIRRWQKMLGLGAVLVLIIGLFISTPTTFVAIGIMANILFTIAVGFKIVSALMTVLRNSEQKASQEEMLSAFDRAGSTPDADLPMYTILIPVFHEANVINLIVEHIDTIDWPKTKLQVLVLAEEVDTDTIAAFKAGAPPDYVRLLVVPDGQPRTKPRACNFGLMFATGEYLVIYDAEDQPEPGQLKSAYYEFILQDALSKGNPTVCLQAALNYFNWDQNLLTRMFTLEYSSWFDGMLPGMDYMRLPIPLGGTSNHFKTQLLRHIGGWDPYNVTEDADLGMRASSAGYSVGTVKSTTWEEACSKTPAWIRQRTRWIKGYMVTSLVDLRHPVRFTRRSGMRSLATMMGLIAGTPLMFLSYPLVWAMTIATYVGLPMVEFAMPGWMASFAVWNAIVGNLAMILLAGLAGTKRQGWRLGMYAVLNPIYWFLHGYAAWRALFQLVLDPHTWEKTPHGLDHGRAEASAVS